MTHKIGFSQLCQMIEAILLANGLNARGARIVAETVAVAERDGSSSHVLMRLQGYASTLKSGWVNREAAPVVMDVAPGLLVTDADNGFAQIALADSRPPLRAKERRE